MWDNLFPSYLSEFPHDESTKGQTPLTLKLERIFQDMQNNFGFKVRDARCTAVPERVWIKKALDHLVVFGMASQDDEKTYTIRYKSLRGDHLERFGELIQRNTGKLALSASKAQPVFPEMEKTAKADPVSEGMPPSVTTEATPEKASETPPKTKGTK